MSIEDLDYTSEDIRDRLQTHLVLLRTCAGWTSAIFGEKLGISRATVSALEKQGAHLTQMQYLAIRMLFETEVRRSVEASPMLAIVLDALVDHPEKYTLTERNEILGKARLMAPSVMKQPEEKDTISTAWKAILAASGVVVSAALIALLKDKN